MPQYTGASKAEPTHYNQNSEDPQETVINGFQSWLFNLLSSQNAPSDPSASNNDMLKLLFDIYMSSNNFGQNGDPNPYSFNHSNNHEARYGHPNFPASHHFHDRDRLYDSSGRYSQSYHDESLRHRHPNDHYGPQGYYNSRYDHSDRGNRRPSRDNHYDYQRFDQNPRYYESENYKVSSARNQIYTENIPHNAYNGQIFNNRYEQSAPSNLYNDHFPALNAETNINNRGPPTGTYDGQVNKAPPYNAYANYNRQYEVPTGQYNQNNEPRPSDTPKSDNNFPATNVNKIQTAGNGSDYNKTSRSDYEGYTGTSKQYNPPNVSSRASNSDSYYGASNFNRERPSAPANDKDYNSHAKPVYGPFDQYNAPRDRSDVNYHPSNVNNSRQPYNTASFNGRFEGPISVPLDQNNLAKDTSNVRSNSDSYYYASNVNRQLHTPPYNEKENQAYQYNINNSRMSDPSMPFDQNIPAREGFGNFRPDINYHATNFNDQKLPTNTESNFNRTGYNQNFGQPTVPFEQNNLSTGPPRRDDYHASNSDNRKQSSYSERDYKTDFNSQADIFSGASNQNNADSNDNSDRKVEILNDNLTSKINHSESDLQSSKNDNCSKGDENRNEKMKHKPHFNKGKKLVPNKLKKGTKKRTIKKVSNNEWESFDESTE